MIAGQALARNDKKVNRAFGGAKSRLLYLKLKSFVTFFIFVSKPGQVERDSRDAIE